MNKLKPRPPFASGGERRREERRAVLHGFVEIDGQSHDLADWSPSGFRTARPMPDFAIGGKLACRLVVKDGEGHIVVAGDCTIVRKTSNHAAKTYEIRTDVPEASEMLAIYRQYWSRMSV